MDVPISVFLITLNEAAHIEQVLSSVAWADEVIVLIRVLPMARQIFARGWVYSSTIRNGWAIQLKKLRR